MWLRYHLNLYLSGNLSMKYKIIIQYDGLGYKGWQRLPHEPKTIQQTVETVLNTLLNETIELTASGRTDAGVSALRQTAAFECSAVLNARTFLKSVNEILPDDIAITDISRANRHFHPRKDAIVKTYAYCISLDPKPDVFIARHIYVPETTALNIYAMEQAAKHLCGTHDFSAYTTDKSDKCHIRTINDISLTLHTRPSGKNMLVICFTGNGFLYNMVRILSGTILEAGLGHINASDIPAITNSLKRENAGPTLPSNALFLCDVLYN